MKRRRFLSAQAALASGLALPPRGGLSAAGDEAPLLASIRLSNLHRSRDGSGGITWFHPRVGEWLPKQDARGDLLLARVRRGRPNADA